MNPRSLLASTLAAVMMTLSPAAVRAQEAEAPPATTWTAPVLRPDVLHPQMILEASRTGLPMPGSPTTELRVSKEAKIIIIVCAIVVGVIILVGVFGVGHHGP